MAMSRTYLLERGDVLVPLRAELLAISFEPVVDAARLVRKTRWFTGAQLGRVLAGVRSSIIR